MSRAKPFVKGWGSCIDCGYEGLLEYHKVEGESYDDKEAFGFMMYLYCPACESGDHSLVTMEYYQELLENLPPDEE
ncbi:MAG: hypothetical protein KAJ19_05680 [Gammaproteobacteria bacterium]|nr:hypothetical protein [Gammaproteobacteria bacterium]